MARQMRRFGRQIEPNLMVGAAQRGKRKADPATTDWPMHMTEEQMTDAVAMRPDYFGEGRSFRQGDAVHHVDANFERGVMHEDVDGPVRWRLGEGAPNPCKAPFAHLPRMARLVERVEKEQPAARGIAPALHK